MRPTRLIALAATVTMAASLAACAGSQPAPDAPASAGGDSTATDGAFPITIEHAYGTTTIPAKPERVATVAWANHEVPLALGVVPVGMSKATWGDDDGDGVLPWVEDRLEELGAETPVLFDDTDGVDFDAVSDTRPDVILAAYSGLSQDEYNTLSKIAPVVAFPDIAWGASYEDMIRFNSRGMGLEKEGDELIASLEERAQKSLADHPALEGKKILFSYLDPSDLSQIGFYTIHDTRAGFIADLGLPMPSVVGEASEGTTEFYTTLSAEEAERFSDVDVFVTYGPTDGSMIKTLQADPLLSKIPAIAAGHISVLEDGTPLAASANPSPLSITWGIDDYFDVLASALG